MGYNMNDNLKNDLIMLLVELQNLNMSAERTSIVEALDMLANEIDSAASSIKTQAHLFLDEGDINKVQKCVQLSNSIGGLGASLSDLKNIETYCVQSSDKVTSAQTTNKTAKPTAFNLKKKKYYLTRQTWRQLFYQVLCVLAEIDGARFEEYIRILNERNLTYYQFSGESDSLLSEVYKNKPLHIPCANLYVRLTGDASVMRRSTYEAISFFNLESVFNIETSNSDANNVINIVDDDDEE